MRSNFLDLANATIANQLTCKTEARIGALLRTRLPDSSIVLRKLDQLLTFTNGERHRLFTIDILALTHRHTSNHCMPVVRRSDNNGIDVGSVEQVAEVNVFLGAFENFGCFLKMLQVDITDRNTLNTRTACDVTCIAQTLAEAAFATASANQANANLVIRRDAAWACCLRFGFSRLSTC